MVYPKMKMILLTIMLFQTCKVFFLLLNTKEDILKNFSNQTVAIDFHSISSHICKSVATSNCLVTNILQISSCVQ